MADVTNHADTVRAVGELVAAVGRIDVAINIAGGFKMGAVHETSEQTWNFLFDLNARSAFNLAAGVVPVSVRFEPVVVAIGSGAAGLLRVADSQTTMPSTVTTPPPIVFTNDAFVGSPQQSPKANKVVGSATVASDGSKVLVEVFNGKPSKLALVGKATKTGVKKGNVPFTVTLSKKASKAAAKKKKGVKMTVRVTITPPSGKAFVKTFKVTVKNGKARSCFRAARVPAHIAC